jgi:hypothetical protein
MAKAKEEKVDKFFSDKKAMFQALSRNAHLIGNRIGRRTSDDLRVRASWLFMRACVTAQSITRLHRASLVVSEVDRLTRSVAFLSRLLEAGVDVRFADLPQIEGATGRFQLQQMVAVAELEAGMISKRTKDALAAAKRRGKKLGGRRRKITGHDERGKPIYGALANGSAKARASATRVRQERAA